MNMSSSPILLTIILSMWLLISCSESTEYLVGEGIKPWRFPLPKFHAFTIWSSTHQFTVGDTIVFEYDKKQSVVEVDEHDYIKCGVNRRKEYLHNDHVYYYRKGNTFTTKVVLVKPGVQYFISGHKGHCHMGLKVKVVVLPLVSPPPPPPPLLSLPPLQSPLPSLSFSTTTSPSHVLSPSLLSSLLSPLTSPSSSLSLLPNSSGSEGDVIGRGFIVWLGILLAMVI